MAEGSFEFNNPRVERIVFGHEKVKTAGDEVARFGVSRALVVVSPSVVKTPLMEKIRGALGGRCAGVFDRVQPHSPTEVIEKAAAQARAARADILISVGGGSAIDTAKGIAVLLAEGGPLPRFGVRFTPPDRKEVPSLPAPKLPHIAIPTTLSGGEYSYSAGITEGGKKFILADPKIAPRTVILDPEAAQTLPARLLAASGMNALAHCVEAIYSTHTQALTQAYCLAGVSRLSEFLPRAVMDSGDLDAIGANIALRADEMRLCRGRHGEDRRCGGRRRSGPSCWRAGASSAACMKSACSPPSTNGCRASAPTTSTSTWAPAPAPSSPPSVSISRARKLPGSTRTLYS